MRWKYDNTFDSFTLNIAPFIISRNILLDDITEAIYMVKVSSADADSDALVTKTLGDGLTKVAGTTAEEDVITVQFSDADFLAMSLNEDYFVGFGIKIAGLTKYIEICLQDNRLRVIPDFIHD